MYVRFIYIKFQKTQTIGTGSWVEQNSGTERNGREEFKRLMETFLGRMDIFHYLDLGNGAMIACLCQELSKFIFKYLQFGRRGPSNSRKIGCGRQRFQISESSGQDGGIGGNSSLPCTPKRRITTNLKSLYNQKCQKIKLHGTPTTKELKKQSTKTTRLVCQDKEI